MNCTNCQHEIPDESKFCPYCGTMQNNTVQARIPLNTDQPQAETKTKKKTGLTIAIIAIILVAIIAAAFFFLRANSGKNNDPFIPANLSFEMTKKQVHTAMGREADKTYDSDTGPRDFYSVDYSMRPAHFDPNNTLEKYAKRCVLIVDYEAPSNDKSHVKSIVYQTTINDLSDSTIDRVLEFDEFCTEHFDDSYSEGTETGKDFLYMGDEYEVYVSASIDSEGMTVYYNIYPASGN